MTYHFSPEPEMDLQFARIMLTGSPLYREIAAQLTSILEKRSGNFSTQTGDANLNEFALRNLDLIKLRCNDLELVKKVNQVVFDRQNGSHITVINGYYETETKKHNLIEINK